MDVNAYISSGILENYCLGFCTTEEIALVENYAELYSVIKKEIEKIRTSLEDFILANKIKPSPTVKIRVMQSLYNQMAATDNEYVPLINEQIDPAILASWVVSKKIPDPSEDFENLYVIELPSTEQVTNFIVYAKTGHETEIHDKFIEYLYVVRGSCTMNFEGRIKSYSEGDIIHIFPNINHSAMVTSQQPMIAIVQRQACA